MMKGDFHMHTRYSDGAYPPSVVLDVAKKAGLTHVSITDHDSMEAYPEAVPAAAALGLNLTYGVELSTSLKGRDCHLLIYGMPPDHPLMREVLQSQKTIRYNRAKRLLAMLKERGIDIHIDDVVASAGHLTLGRVHVARAMVEAGHVSTMKSAFDQHLVTVARKAPSPFPNVIDMIQTFRAAGALTVLAHPANYYGFLELKSLVSAGLEGLECIHPSHDAAQRAKYFDYARLCQLIPTGGSDFHGHKPEDHTLVGMVAMTEPESTYFLERMDYASEHQR